MSNVVFGWSVLKDLSVVFLSGWFFDARIDQELKLVMSENIVDWVLVTVQVSSVEKKGDSPKHAVCWAVGYWFRCRGCWQYEG